MSKKNQKLMAAVACVLATGTLFGGLVPTHAEGERVTNKGKVDLNKYFQSEGLGSNLDNEDVGARDDWFYGQRFGDGVKPDPVARETAEKQAKMKAQYTIKNKNSNLSAHTADVIPTWKNIGPSPIKGEYWTKGDVSGRVTSMSQASDGTVYIGSAGGGVWSTKDGGNNWKPLTDNMPSLAIGSVAAAPSDANTVYAGTGENPLVLGTDAFYGQGLLATHDGGKTWVNLHQDLFTGQRITSLVVNKTDAKTILFGSTIGLFASNDGGVTLSNGNTPIAMPGITGPYQVTSIVQNGSTVFVAVAQHGVYKSTDGGQTFALATDFQTDNAAVAIGNTALALAPSNPNVIYAGVSNYDLLGNTGALTGLYVSKDAGATWTKLANTPDYTTQASYYLDGDYSQGWYDNAIIVNPKNPNQVTVAGIGILTSKDGGKSWTNIVDRNSGIHPDEHTMMYDKQGNLWIGNDGGVFLITAGGQKKDLNTNLVLTQDYPGMSIFNNGQQVITGAQDNGSQLYYGPNGWRSVWTGDGAQTLADPTDPNKMFISYVNGDLYKTTNGGYNVFTDWTYAAPHMKSSEWVAPLAMDPTNPDVIYEGGDNVYKSTNGATNTFDDQGNITAFGWSNVTQHSSTDPLVYDASVKRRFNVTTIAVAPSNPNVVYAGYGNGYMEMSTDAGATWKKVSPDTNWTSNPDVKQNWITGITVDPQNPYNVYVTQSGYRPLHYQSQGHVWHNANTSASNNTWNDLSGLDPNSTTGLPNAPVNAVALTDDKQLVAATDVGVFESSGNGTWVNMGQGLPNVEVVDVKVAGGVVFAATHGRGTWELSLTQGTNTPSSVEVNTTSLPIGTASYLYGRVVDSNNNPVANASVDLSVNGKTVGTVTTAYDGNYSVPYTAIGTKVGSTLKVTATVSKSTITSSENVAVTTAPVSKITMNVAKTVTAGSAFTITGKATDKFGNAVANASLDLFIDENDYTIVQTDDKGNYSFDVVAPTQLKDEDGNLQNKVNFWVAWQQNEGVTSKPQTVNFVADAVSDITLTVNGNASYTTSTDSAITLKGTVTDQYENGIGGGTVSLYMNGKFWKRVSVKADGTYSVLFTPLGKGTYTFTAVYNGTKPALTTNDAPVTITVQ